MNVLHITSHDLMGGRFTGLYHQQTTAAAGHRFEVAVWEKKSDYPHVHQISGYGLPLVNAAVTFVQKVLSVDSLLFPTHLALIRQPYFQQADVVHLHLVSKFLSLWALPRLSRLRPTVWTLHNPQATNGRCVHSFDCDRWLTGCTGTCPYPIGSKAPLRCVTPALMWQIKRQVYRRMDIDLIVASQWMRDRVRRSPLLNHLPCHLIPYGIDLQAFSPEGRVESRYRLGIPAKAGVMAFRGVRVQGDRYKGCRYIFEALQLLEPGQPCYLLVLDDGTDFRPLQGRYQVVDLGWVDDTQLVSDALRAADVFLMPSLQEAFGLMAVEAMACGTPVIVFDGTALPEVIKAPHGGLVVPSRDSRALAAAIHTLLNNEVLWNRLASEGRQIAEAEYSMELQVRRHLEVYTRAIERHKRAEVGGPGRSRGRNQCPAISRAN